VKVLLIATALCLGIFSPYRPQQRYPDPPNDLTRIYYLNDSKLVPFEEGSVSLNVFVPAVENKITQVRIKGPTATTILNNDNLRFYAFIADRMDPPPHQLVAHDDELKSTAQDFGDQREKRLRAIRRRYDRVRASSA
jgi:hypothetical protein